MRTTVETKIKLKQVNAATGKVVSETPWQKNLVLDAGLNSLARSSAGAGASTTGSFTTRVMVGSGTNPTKTSSGAITFTQSGTTLTASGGFFTAAMAGALFKWGTGSGGVEVYITAYTSATQVTVATSATVSTPDVGAVWFVNQTTLQTQLYSSATYQTNTGDNETTFVGGVMTHKRTYIIAQQASNYTVNEIGYSNGHATIINGRIVLSSSQVVSNTNFLVIVISVAFTVTPTTPTAVANIGTNINTAGNAMLEWWNFARLQSSGTVQSNGMESTNLRLRLATATWTQNSSPASAAASAPTITAISNTTDAVWTYVAASVGIASLTFNGQFSVAGQTLYGFFILGGSGTSDTTATFSLKLTTPVVLPTGTYQPATVLRLTYGRTLTN